MLIQMQEKLGNARDNDDEVLYIERAFIKLITIINIGINIYFGN
jgi:hypothetical protein